MEQFTDDAMIDLPEEEQARIGRDENGEPEWLSYGAFFGAPRPVREPSDSSWLG